MSCMELRNVSYTYPGEKMPVINNLTLQVERGTCLAVRGDNGSGKTTLFRLLNGLAFPDTGRYIFEGTVITEKYLKNSRASKAFHKKIGYLFQNPDVMLFNGTVYDEIAFGPRQMGLPDDEADRRTRDCLQLFRIGHLAEKAPYHLSGGQKKRVALAAVMALNPDVLILDEPMAGLDAGSRAFLYDFLSQLKKAGKTLIMATHDEQLVRDLADQVLVLEMPALEMPETEDE